MTVGGEFSKVLGGVDAKGGRGEGGGGDDMDLTAFLFKLRRQPLW